MSTRVCRATGANSGRVETCVGCEVDVLGGGKGEGQYQDPATDPGNRFCLAWV